MPKKNLTEEEKKPKRDKFEIVFDICFYIFGVLVVISLPLVMLYMYLVKLYYRIFHPKVWKQEIKAFKQWQKEWAEYQRASFECADDDSKCPKITCIHYSGMGVARIGFGEKY